MSGKAKRGATPRTPQKAFALGMLTLAATLFIGSAHAAATDPLELREAVASAQQHDPWLIENRHSQAAVEAMSVAASTMADPTVAVGLNNVPTDTFDLDQEPMTQIKVGITQMLPRGDSLDLKRRQLQAVGSRFPHLREDRKAKTAVTVSQLWFDAYKAQESIALIEEDRPLFEQLAAIAEASYSSAHGKTRQRDIVRAHLELTRLEDRLTKLRQQQEMSLERLSGWILDTFGERYLSSGHTDRVGGRTTVTRSLPRQLAVIPMLRAELYTGAEKADPERLYSYFSAHPAVLALDKMIEARNLEVELAKQSYKPMWGINAGYGYRQDQPSGEKRADFISVGLSFDLPFFTADKQDKVVESAFLTVESTKTAKWALVRDMIADFQREKSQLKRLNERHALYRERLLPQMFEQAEASLTAYTNDEGDFAEVVRSRIAELNGVIEALEIDVELQKTIVRLNYLFAETPQAIIGMNEPR